MITGCCPCLGPRCRSGHRSQRFTAACHLTTGLGRIGNGHSIIFRIVYTDQLLRRCDGDGKLRTHMIFMVALRTLIRYGPNDSTVFHGIVHCPAILSDTVHIVDHLIGHIHLFIIENKDIIICID